MRSVPPNVIVGEEGTLKTKADADAFVRKLQSHFPTRKGEPMAAAPDIVVGKMIETHEDAEQNKGSIGSAHTDVRMLPSGVATWEGFELFTPGRPGEHNKLLDYKSGEKIMMNFKIPHAEERPKDGELPVVRGPKSWMTIAARKPAVLNPGEPGATAHKWARIEQLDTFHWTAGTQDEHYKEFRLDFNKHEKLSGRWVMMYAPLRAGKFWLMTRPEEQRMDAERNEKGMEYRKLIDEVSGALGSGKSADDIEKGWT